MPLIRTRFFAPVLFLAYVIFATIVAGVAAPGAGLAVLVVGLFSAVVMDHARWQVEEAGRTTLRAPFRPDPYGLRHKDSAEPERPETIPIASV